MVLTSPRFALVVAIALGIAVPCGAQRGERGGRMGRGASDGPRPILMGFALECSGCTRERPDGDSMLPVWHYVEYPRVAAVAPDGAAELAGIREGDRLVAVDGISILSSEGARRFSSARNTGGVRLTFERGGKSYDAELAPRLGRGGMFGARGGFLREPVPREYSGQVGNVMVDATSDEPVIATTDSLGAVTLRIAGTVVRIRPSPVLKTSKSVKLENKPKPKPEKLP